jgi:DHA1 family multidrug resistance protein B-like MFS transporter
MAVANSAWFVSPWLTYAMFFLNTVLVAIATPASEAIVIDVTTQDTRKYVYGLSYWITNLCIAAGTMVGALLYEHYFFELLASSAAASLITWFVTARFIKESGPAKQLRQAADISFKRIVSSYQGELRDKHFAQYLLVGILMLGLEMQLTGYIGVRLSESFVTQPLLPLSVLDMPVSGVNMLGILRTENTLLVVLFAGLLMRLSQRFSDLTLLCIGTVLFACGYALLSVSGIGWVLLLGTLIFSIGELLYVPVHQALLADLVQDSMRSQYMAVNALRLRGAMLLGALGVTVGALIPPWMMAAAYLLTGCCCLLLYSSLILRLREFRSSGMSSGSIEMNG